MVGRTISHYRVLRTVGSGGMGEVYEAEDLKLGRRVALKFLSAARAITPDAQRRFEREARAASALNHPNICTIHEFGEHEAQRFIVMELLHGTTLRDRLRHQRCGLEECLGVAIEVADALDTAHRAGVVHRDLTPSNIFVTDEHHAKVVDFGLAKMEFAPVAAARHLPADASTMPADPAALTSPGAMMGTIAYMSPEQITGEEIDARSDLFSFGCVLYEMATGTRPFAGKTTALIFDAILHQTPVPASARNPHVPVGLQQIVDKAIEKDRALRYQSASEIKRDLERVRRDAIASLPLPRPAPVARRWWGLAVVGALVLVVGAVVLYLRGIAGRDAIPASVARQITSMPGQETEPAISPDGATIAFTARTDSGNDDIWVVDVHGGPPQRITTNPARDRSPAWFPDGRTLAFVSDRNGGRSAIWRAPRLDGDAATLLIPGADDPAVSPRGDEIAFVRSRGAYNRIAIARVDDPSTARFVTGDADGKWDHGRPAWSPDGQTICYDAWDGLWLVPARGGAARRLTTADAHNDVEPAWSSDGRHIYFTGLRDRQSSLWRVARDGGVPERVTVGSGTERTPRVALDGRIIAFSTAAGMRDVVVRDLASGKETQFGSSREDIFPVFSPDGTRIYFVSDRWGSFDIWMQPMRDGEPVGPASRVAEADGIESHLACSPDGRWLAYYRILNGARDIFIIPAAGGAARRITDDSGALDPAWSPDGSQLAFSSERDGTSQIWTQRIVDGKPAGAARRITSGPGSKRSASWSPDGSTVAFTLTRDPSTAEAAIVPASGGAPRVLTAVRSARCVRWTTTAGLLVAAMWSGSQFEVRALDVPPAVLIQKPVSISIGSDSALFNLSTDGRFLVWAKGPSEGDIWILEAGARRF